MTFCPVRSLRYVLGISDRWMKYFYKDHHIDLFFWVDTEGWSVNLYVYYQHECTNVLTTFSLKEKFTIYDEAVKAGIAAAQRWIDNDN